MVLVVVILVIGGCLLLKHIELFPDVLNDGLNYLLHLALVRLGPDHELRLDDGVKLVRR